MYLGPTKHPVFLMLVTWRRGGSKSNLAEIGDEGLLGVWFGFI